MAAPLLKPNARLALLDAAEQLFTERSYDAVSTRDLADAAKVNLGAIQYHFGSKAKLFIETIHQMMERESSWHGAFSTIHLPQPASLSESAELLSQFVFYFCSHLLRPTGPQACRVMFREILGESSSNAEVLDPLVRSVVENYTSPNQDLLLRIVSGIIPDASELRKRQAIASIIGQCTFYVSHKPFVERLWGISVAASPHLENIAAHVARFSLSALGVSENIIEQAIAFAERSLEKEFKSKDPESVQTPTRGSEGQMCEVKP